MRQQHVTLRSVKDSAFRTICGAVGSQKYVVMRRIRPVDETHGSIPRAQAVSLYETRALALDFVENDFYAKKIGKGHRVLRPSAPVLCEVFKGLPLAQEVAAVVCAIENLDIAEYIIYRMTGQQVARAVLEHGEVYPDFETLPASLAAMAA